MLSLIIVKSLTCWHILKIETTFKCLKAYIECMQYLFNNFIKL